MHWVGSIKLFNLLKTRERVNAGVHLGGGIVRRETAHGSDLPRGVVGTPYEGA